MVIEGHLTRHRHVVISYWAETSGGEGRGDAGEQHDRDQWSAQRGQQDGPWRELPVDDASLVGALNGLGQRLPQSDSFIPRSGLDI